MFKGKHLVLIIMLAIFTVSGMVGNYLYKLSEAPSDTKQNNSPKPIEKQVVAQDADVTFGKLYQKCNHLIKEQPDRDLQGLALSALLKRYKPEDGWVVDTLNPKRIMIYQQVDALCPEDEAKRHLGVKGEFVAVYKGPVGVDGGVERVTDIKVKELPKEFQEKLKKGAIDFADENQLMEALDTMDEYSE